MRQQKKLGFLEKAVIFGASVAAGLSSVESANGAEITAYNHSSSIPYGQLQFLTTNEANEAGDSRDIVFISRPENNALEISSNEPGFKAGTNAKPENTPYCEMDLSVKGVVSGNNSLKVKVWNDEGLENRDLIAYNSADPNTVYDLDKTVGIVTTIVLDNLINQPAGIYATWYISTPAIQPGDCASEAGPGKLDGRVDLWDAVTVYDSWLTQTEDGENYSHGDLNYDGKNDLQDHAILSENWLAGTE